MVAEVNFDTRLVRYDNIFMKKSVFECPECGSAIKAWADVDAQMSFVISKSGKLTKQIIQNNFQSDSRCGVECTECDWRLYSEDMEGNHPFQSLALEALERQSMIDEFSSKRK